MGVVHKGPPQGEGVWSNEDTSGQMVKESRTLRTSTSWYFFLLVQTFCERTLWVMPNRCSKKNIFETCRFPWVSPCGRPHRKLKVESTDVILSSFHAKKLASVLPEFLLWTE